MALVTTTLSAAVGVDDREITVASATSIEAGRIIVVDSEQMEVTKGYVTASTTVPVLRGKGGTATQAHVSSAEVTHGAAEDFGDVGVGVTVNYPPAGRTRRITGYSASGAIALPKAGEDAVAILYGTTLTMTLADPDEALTGSILHIINATASAHTVDASSGFGGAGSSYNLLTFDGTGQNWIQAMACGGVWLLSVVDGTTTSVATTIS